MVILILWADVETEIKIKIKTEKEVSWKRLISNL